jgi:hypothetical protein
MSAELRLRVAGVQRHSQVIFPSIVILRLITPSCSAIYMRNQPGGKSPPPTRFKTWSTKFGDTVAHGGVQTGDEQATTGDRYPNGLV